MNGVLSGLLSLQGPWVYLGISLLVFLEAAAFVGLVVPGETAMLVAGVLAARGNVSLPVILALGAAAAVGGDSFGYAIGRRFGPTIEGSRAGRWVGPERWARAHRYVRSRGAWAVVLGRWVGVLRALVPAVAGMTEMPYRRFFAANAVGGILWVATVVGIGYAAGGSVVAAQQVLGNFSMVGAVVTVALLISAVAAAKVRRRAPGATNSAVATALDRRSWRLVVPSLVLATATLGVAELAEGVREGGDLAAYDPAVTAEMVGGRSSVVTPLAEAFTFIGSTVGLGVLSLALVLWVGLRQRRWRVAAMVAGAMTASAALTLALKDITGRVRPPAGTVLGPVDSSFAFPSGHTLNATVFFGLVAAIAWSRTTSVANRTAIALGWIGASSAVGLSRIYLGYHWMTDVLAGFGTGLAVLAATAVGAVLVTLRSPSRSAMVAHEEREA
ncbi:bifunctional DedA family/phosphatase PAP2 family protein [Phycicoccus sp. MAQZ13P-2]|uniref:bifunctional DedA family/phosphatase PAP2 family protein n=1 Tax=Phycicoccus mangrovi TaxID=2840470 RepID=UPI001C0073EB|nr:bifunctional DedA family/phosphatase PAP2 family protein [Phycicoccus mangrovi]MBT9257154.1 bifunctional DedA family/phosphatase PAP2 family protein [Phycicoccus mangrovi]MBT9276347.1 bifunctional DedA family/phosphatase PAP2 family protein [Phycicoccus mangrovi]